MTIRMTTECAPETNAHPHMVNDRHPPSHSEAAVHCLERGSMSICRDRSGSLAPAKSIGFLRRNQHQARPVRSVWRCSVPLSPNGSQLDLINSARRAPCWSRSQCHSRPKFEGPEDTGYKRLMPTGRYGGGVVPLWSKICCKNKKMALISCKDRTISLFLRKISMKKQKVKFMCQSHSVTIRHELGFQKAEKGLRPSK